MFENIIDEIENDELYKSFFKDNKTAEIRGTLSFSEQITKLSEGIDILSIELQSQVREQHGALLSQASHAGRLDAALNTVANNMERILNGSNRIKSQIGSQYNLVENQTKVLGRLHAVSHILRLCGRLIQMAKKLKSTKDPAKQATLLYELEFITDDPSLNKIEFIKEDRSFVLAARQRLNNLAQMDLINGMKNGNELQVINSLQIFANLKTIRKCIENLIETFLNDITHSIKECFAGIDVSSLSSTRVQQIESRDGNKNTRGPGKTPNLTTTQNFRTKLWNSLQWLINEEICDYCQQITLLQKCLKAIYQNSNALENNGVECKVLEEFWNRLQNLLKTSFTDCPPHIAQCLQEGLPKLLSAARGLQVKLSSLIVFNDSTFQSLEAGYLEKCASNLKLPLAGTDCPTSDAVDSLIRAASIELSAAMVDQRLSMLVAGAFNACNKDFYTKIEANIKFGTDSKQVVDLPNSAQIQNTNLSNLIHYHADSVKRLTVNLGDSFSISPASKSITNDLKYGKNLIIKVLQQLIDSMTTTIGIILLSMHREPGMNSDKINTSGPSLYMKELQDFLQRGWTQHILPFTDKEAIDECGQHLSSKCIELFVNNIAILRPISSPGRSRLKSDCSHLENALKFVVKNLSNLGKPFRLLRAISSLITQSPEMLITQEIEIEAPVPCHIILLLLFTYAGSELQSPHHGLNWSNERLVQWLTDQTSQKERLELVAGALQRYRTTIRQKNITQYDPVYPLISNYFEKAYKTFI